MHRPRYSRFSHALTAGAGWVLLGIMAQGAVMVSSKNSFLDAAQNGLGTDNRFSVDGTKLAMPSQEKMQEYRARFLLMEADSQMITARKLFDAKKYAEALTELTRLEQTNPANPVFKMAMADTFLKLGNTTNAIESARAAVKLAPGEQIYRMLLSQAYTQNKEYQPALNEVRKCLEINSSNTSARLNQGILLNKMGRTEESIAYFKSEIEKQPEYLAGHNMLGVLYYSRGDYTNAVIHFDHMARLAPADPGGPINAGLAMLALNRHREALERFRAIIKRSPENPEGFGFAGICLERLHEPDKALQMYRQALYVDPEYLDGYVLLTGLLVAQEKPAEAEKVLRQRLEKSPSSTMLHRLLAEILRHNNQHKEAVLVMCEAMNSGLAEPENWRLLLTSYKKLLEELNHGPVKIAPGQITNHFERSAWHYKQFVGLASRTGSPEAALHLVHAALLDGSQPAYFNDLGTITPPFLGYIPSLSFYIAALFLDPTLESSRLNLISAVLKVEPRDQAKAFASLVEHLKRVPNQPEFNYCAACLLTRMKRPAEALVFYRHAVESAPNALPFLLDYGKALYLSGDGPGALYQCRSALQRMPNNFQLQYLAAWVVLQMENPDASDLEQAEINIRKASLQTGTRDPRYPWLTSKVLAARGKWEPAAVEAQKAIDIATKLKKEDWVKWIRDDLAGYRKKKIAPRDAERGYTHPLFSPPHPAEFETAAATANH